MISEVERIQSGLIESTVEFNTQRKVIGVATTNLLPNENGIVPLSKQGAFQVVEQVVEQIDFNEVTETQNNEVTETMEQLDLPTVSETLETPVGLQEPVHNDVLTENPVNVENPEDLSGFKIPEPVMEEEPAVMEPVGPALVDIQMPQMPATVVANEPEAMDENIFETVSTTLVEEPTSIPTLTESEAILNTIPVAEEVVEEAPTFEPLEDITTPNDINIEMPVIETPVELQEIVEEVVPEQIVQETIVQETVQTPEEILNPIEEPVKEEVKEDINVPEILDIDKILEQNRNTLLAYADELIKTADQIKAFVNKTFDDLSVNIKNTQKTGQKVEETIQLQNEITSQANNMVTTGNNLVDDAISRINAISEPGLTL